MKTKIQLFIFIFFILIPFKSVSQKIYTTYLWHMDQPVYWPDQSKDKPDSRQFAEESQKLKLNGTNMYPGSPVAHPTNNLEEIFSKADRVQAYQSSPRNALNSIKDINDAGAQLSISGGLMENVRSLGAKNMWGYTADWLKPYKEAIGWKTPAGYPRLDVVGFTFDHALSPLVSERTLIKQIKAHQYASEKYYGYVSKGYWPAECAFSERIIKALVSCNIQWSVVANGHLARTLSDYVHPYNINGNIEAPNRADRVTSTGINWFDAVIDGRGSRLAAPYCYQAHKAQYIDPLTGTAYKIDVVPMCNYLSYVDGYSGANTGDISSKIEPFSNTEKPSIVLLAHDGDNAWGGGSSYYNEAVTGFSHAAANAGYKPTTIQQFLNEHSVSESDIIHVEDGAWVNAENDWGHPQFINWLWPLYTKPDYRFDPEGWTEDARNWAVITATENFVTMAEDLEGGNLRMEYIADGGTNATNAEKAWHFYFGALNSGFMYYGKAEDMEVKPSLAGNIAIDFARNVISRKPETDNTAPSVFIPQRFPYNPGSTGFGSTTGYKKVNYSTDFHVWTFAYDVSGLTSVKLKYRTDYDGKNPVESIQNEIYAGTNEVTDWAEVEMTRKPIKSDPTNDAELNFFIQPQAKADLCYAEIKGLKDTLVDYYVEAVDTKGNIYRSPVQHVYIESGNDNSGGGTNENISWNPLSPTTADIITISCKNATANSRLHWGVNDWTTPLPAYHPSGTSASTGQAVETPFELVEGNWQVTLGAFNNPAQAVTKINFVINHGGSWDNNNGSDYQISVSPLITNNPVGQNINKTLNQNTTYNFSVSDFGFYSPRNNSFKAVKITTLPASGTLSVNGSAVEVNQLIENPALLTYTSAMSNASFTFKLTDSENLESDAVYTAAFTVKDPTAPTISVSFKRPDDWGTTPVYLWAWNAKGNLFSSWPGVAMTDKGNGWFTYTFDASVTNVNVIFSKNGSPQTVDITGITQTTCFQASGLNGNKITVSTVDCDATAVHQPEISLRMLIYPQPASDKFVLELPNISGEFIYSLFDSNGKVLMSGKFSETTRYFDIKDLDSGLYVIRVVLPEYGQVLYGKVFKK